MVRTICGIFFFVIASGPALAEEGSDSASMVPWVVHWAITLLGMALAGRLAAQAFNRPSVPVADLPTFPRYMTNRLQYQFGSWIFVIFASGFFLLLVQQHREVVKALELSHGLIPIPQDVLDAVKDQSAPYLVVITVMGAVYLYFLTKEAQWNVLLMMRDVIQGWISIPQLADRIVAQIRFSLRTPNDAIPKVIASSKAVSESDFRKDTTTLDRAWAEICYMKWWLTQGHDAREDATFFTEQSFGFDKILADFQRASLNMESRKSGLAMDNLPQEVKDLHNRISRLVACYLIYRNGSREDLSDEARKFGLDLSQPPAENPLQYWVVYAIALIVSVYVGVCASAISYDMLTGEGFNIGQDLTRTLAWIMYTLSNYGLAIFAILLLRFASRSLQIRVNQSHLLTYCWTFLAAFVVGPLGLTIAVHFFGEGDIPQMPIHELYFSMLKWGMGPALVSVYISYYLDRQTCEDLPDIDYSLANLRWRLINCFGFAAVTVFLLLPSLLSLKAQPNAIWDTPKLRFIATGCTFCVVFGLALAAQFALRKGTQAAVSRVAKIYSQNAAGGQTKILEG